MEPGAVVGNLQVSILADLVDDIQVEAFDAQGFQIVQPGDNAPQVTHTVTVGILEALGVDLIKHGGLPPALFALIQQQLCHKNHSLQLPYFPSLGYCFLPVAPTGFCRFRGP